MRVVREIRRISGKRITIDLPDAFRGKEVEILVIPYKRIPVADGKDEWKRDFLSVSQWDITEEDVKTKSWIIPEL